MKTKIKVKNVFAALFIFSLGTLMILAANKSNTEDKVTLHDLSFYKGPLINFYPDELWHSSTGTTSKFIALEINGPNQKIRVFKPGENYSEFYSNIRIGDTVSIFYRKHSPDFFNSDIYQLDINNKNYLRINDVESNAAKGNIAILIIGLFLYAGAIYVFLKK